MNQRTYRAIAATCAVLLAGTLPLPAMAGGGGIEPGVINIEVDLRPAKAALATAGGPTFELSVTGEPSSPEWTTWKLSVTTNLGWKARTSSTGFVPTPAAMTLGDDLPPTAFSLTTDGSGVTPAGWLVIDVAFEDASGRHADGRERFHFDLRKGNVVVATPAEFEQASAQARAEAPVPFTDGTPEWVQGLAPWEIPTLTGSNQDAAYASAPGESLAMAAASSCVGHGLQGFLSFWDTRNHRSNAPGSRLTTCDATNLGCYAWLESDSCCMRRVVGPRVVVLKENPATGAWTDVGSTADLADDGFFSVCVGLNEWEAGAKFALGVYWQRNSLNPGFFAVTNAGGSVARTVVDLPAGIQDLGDAWNYFWFAKVNPHGDATSPDGDYASAFASTYATFRAVHAEGVTDLAGDFNLLTKVRYGSHDASLANSSNCAQTSNYNAVYLQQGYARTEMPARLLGQIYHGRVVGCAPAPFTSRPAYPRPLNNPYMHTTAEGHAFSAAIEGLVMTLSYWDPEVATTMSIAGSLAGCINNSSYPNSNNAGSWQNNYLGLWEFIDASTANTHPGNTFADSVNLTLNDIGNALFHMKNWNGSPGYNRKNQERTLSPIDSLYPEWGCFSSDWCEDYAACIGGQCYDGDCGYPSVCDPHGENIRDFAQSVADTINGNEWSWAGLYDTTLRSSPCLGTYVDGYPFTGGFVQN